MVNFKTLTIIKRELNEKLMSRSFIIMTLIIPILMLVMINVQRIIMSYQSDKGSQIEILTESSELTDKFKASFTELSFVKDATYTVSFCTVSREGLKDYIQGRKQDILSQGLNAVVFIPSKALKNKEIEYYSNTPSNRTIPERLYGPINELLIDNYFSTKNIDKEDLDFARKSVNFSSYKVSKKDDIQEESFGNSIIAAVLTALIYISLLSSGPMTMQSVLKEKSDKIVEVLLSSVSSKELMTGKILGVTITSIAQMIIWLLPVLFLISTSWIVLPGKMTIDISYMHLIYFLINFLLAVLIYQGLFATIGAIFDNPQEAQPAVMPVMILLMIPFFISISAMQNPNSTLAVISSFVPFATFMIMPGRFALVDVPLWHLVISTLINIGTILAIFPLAGKIYSIGILHIGKKPTWNEVLRWLK